MMKARKTLLAGLAAVLLAGAGSGNPIYLCIGNRGQTRLKTAEELCRDDVVRAACVQESRPRTGDQWSASDADCCLDILMALSSQGYPAFPVCDPRATISANPSAQVDRTAGPLRLTIAPDLWKPPPSTNCFISSLRTVVLLV